MKPANVPQIVITRLSLYARNIALLEQQGVEVVSSSQLADMCGVNPAQVRKDLAHFGEFGVRGVGYYVNELLYEIRKILGGDKEWRLGLVGVGNLGWALLRHVSVLNTGFTFVAAFDRKLKRVGVKIGGIEIAPWEAMDHLIKDNGVEIGVIAVKPQWAQEAADRLVTAGVSGILNFTPIQLHCPIGVYVENVDFTLKLDALCYKLALEGPR